MPPFPETGAPKVNGGYEIVKPGNGSGIWGAGTTFYNISGLS